MMKQQLTHYIKAGFSGLFLSTQEEDRARAVMVEVAQETGFKLFCWTWTKGLIDASTGQGRGSEGEPLELLNQFKQLDEQSIVMVFDLAMTLFGQPNSAVYRAVKDALADGKKHGRVLMLVGSPPLNGWPRDLEKEFTQVDLTLPDTEQLTTVLRNIVKSANDSGKALTVDANAEAALVSAAAGLTTIEAENSFALSIVSTGGLDPEVVGREKSNIVRKGGLLEIVDAPETMDDIGGLGELKKWISEVVRLFSPEAEAYGIKHKPRGVIFVGPSGTGKSLTAKAVRAAFETILVRMDIGKLKGRYVGESENKMRDALAQIEAIGKCVVWVEEIDKALKAVSKGSGNLDSGASAGQFDALLYKLEEGMKGAFFAITCNGVFDLPPEFLQRFDDIFFVDLPSDSERREVLTIWLRKLGCEPKKFDLAKLAKATNGFSGREIKKTCLASQRKAFVAGKEMATAYVLEAAGELIPTSKSNAADYDALRTWAKGNARPANTPEPEEAFNPAAKALRKIA